MGGQEKLYIIAIVVAVLVIIGLVAVFTFLFFLYSFYKVRHIDFGLEDESLLKEVKEKASRVNKKRKEENKEPLTLKQVFEEEKKINSILHRIMDCLSSVVIIFFLSLFVIGVTYAANNEHLYIGNTTYLTILTSSMEEKHEKNDYLVNLDNQITQYCLVGVEKIENEDDVKLYDIIAYEYDGVTILHRVIEIGEDEETGETVYTLRGDSNPSSLSYEIDITFDKFIGKYNGYYSYCCGVFITYIKSSIGIITLVGASVFILLAALAEERINRSYEKRLKVLTDEHGHTVIFDLNDENLNELNNEEETEVNEENTDNRDNTEMENTTEKNEQVETSNEEVGENNDETK